VDISLMENFLLLMVHLMVMEGFIYHTENPGYNPTKKYVLKINDYFECM
jgi:hypothetical protein